jgi:glycosyltransferase involved in cell wall biosynthesis
MKVLHLSFSDYKGGAARAALRIHKSLLKKKISSFLKVNLSSDQNICKNILKPNFLINNYNLIKSSFESVVSRLLASKKFVKNSISLFPTNIHKFINQSDFDIINLHWINGETISIEDIGKIKKPIVWTLHDMWPFCGSEHYILNNINFLKKYSLKYAKKKKLFSDISLEKFTFNRKLKAWKNKMYIVGVSNWISKVVSKSYLMNHYPCQTIFNTLDIKFWKTQNKLSARKYFNLPNNIKLIGFDLPLNYNAYLKGKDIFLSAIQNISLDKNKYAFLIIGGSDNFMSGKNLPKIFNILKLKNNIEMRNFYNCLDVLVVPSRVESFGQIASEAASCGVPVVAFDFSGLKDIIIHKKTGWLAKPYNSKNIAQGINFILNLKIKDFKRMSKLAAGTAKKKFSYDIIANKYIRLYKKILNNK